MSEFSTIEYVNQKSQIQPNIFLLVVDLALEEVELDALRDSIQQSLNIIPPDSYVGLITYGKFVFVHELGFSECPKSYAFKGSKEYNPIQVQEMLGLIAQGQQPKQGMNLDVIKRFLLPLNECEFTLNSILDDLQPDPWIVPQGEREQRASGVALNVAMSIIEACPIQGSRLMFFTGGPCTIGPGQIIGLKLEENLRSYYDLNKETEMAKHVKKTTKYYQGIAQRAIKILATIDIYGFSADQFGLLEMKSISEKTGGYTIVNEEFNSEPFRETFRKIFEKNQQEELRFASAAKIEMFVCKELKIQGGIGPCSSMKKGGPMVSEVPIGQGGTNQWYVGGMDRNSTITFLLDLAPQNKEQNSAKRAFFQFQTIYKSPSGETKLRVTTVHRKFGDQINSYDWTQGFDQEAACVMMARLAIQKAEQEEPIEILKWLDRSLIRLVTKFAEYKPNQPDTFRLNDNFSLYPQLMYHLRRSHFTQTFGTSPDIISYYRGTFNRENVTNCLVMIQPALLMYTYENPTPVATTLEDTSMKNNVILLLDTYFQVITWLGPQIKLWKDKQYHLDEQYAQFKTMLESPMEDVKMILEDRFPTPIFFETYPNHTKERYLKARINPTGLNQDVIEGGHTQTDDASLTLFMDHLIKLAVQQQNY
ncbi:protein transport protein, putative [Ichthyophthirius multifiliis]|uniref:Protein transport protein SEC23 n=1 Tax=Ichthyophthirius multifiliis TaxID=5932 RepID=G0QPZ9_ICHMU|nr:protein transport protein, putative [Ichthyophthirius multifiliis]EGR32706.1 protein transport protein, putative [Ichthyophthirius multifiliis]|eukprot:XP_004036692.1 protein transport protein, putative [Ichthyophthirius multifiliis]